MPGVKTSLKMFRIGGLVILGARAFSPAWKSYSARVKNHTEDSGLSVGLARSTLRPESFLARVRSGTESDEAELYVDGPEPPEPRLYRE